MGGGGEGGGELTWAQFTEPPRVRWGLLLAFVPPTATSPPQTPRFLSSSLWAGCGVPSAQCGEARSCSLLLREVPLYLPAQTQACRQRHQRVPRLPSFPGTSGGRRAPKRKSPRESLIPPLQVLSSMLAGEGGWLPAPARSPGSGLRRALAPAGSA